MPKPAKPQTTSKTAKPMVNIRRNADYYLTAREHRKEMDAPVLEPAPTPTDDNNGSNVTTILCTTSRGKEWNDILDNYLNNL